MSLSIFTMSVPLTNALPLQIQVWSPTHPHWAQVQAVIEQLEQAAWVDCVFDWHQSRHLLVATKGDAVVGFLHLVTQFIGTDEELPLTEIDGRPLLEAKVMALGVVEGYRRQGIGRALQEAALRLAKQLGCYQLRSHSSGDNQANHRLKLAMGFAIHRIVRGEDQQGADFIMPLQGDLVLDTPTKEPE